MVECALKGQKICVLVLLLLQSVICCGISIPRALPWADIFLPLWGVPSPCQSHLALNADGWVGTRDDEIFLPYTSKKTLQKMYRKIRKKSSARAGKPNAARGVGQRRTRCLQFPHAKLPNTTGGIWQKNTRELTGQQDRVTLSLLSVGKFVLANRLSEKETRFKPLFCVQGRKVPPDQK